MGPIALADAKLYLRIDSEEEDELVTRLIAAAAGHMEATYGIVAVKREITLQFGRFAAMLRLPFKPVDAGTITISYLDRDGETQSFADWRLIDRDGWQWLAPKIGSFWPSPAMAEGVITLTFQAGFGDPEIEDDLPVIPVDIQQATRIMLDHWYANRGSSAPPSVDFLLDHYRFRRV